MTTVPTPPTSGWGNAVPRHYRKVKIGKYTNYVVTNPWSRDKISQAPDSNGAPGTINSHPVNALRARTKHARAIIQKGR